LQISPYLEIEISIGISLSPPLGSLPSRIRGPLGSTMLQMLELGKENKNLIFKISVDKISMNTLNKELPFQNFL
jgi:hypothetical protein